ncbi:hypothetical protein BGZ70_003203 [Mortierella alpina]|uniref:Uncharacterized protein n=1 Tax=Mortierella alpina TaxID=64518 RepID=A0A9P6JE45_MORAP|nr:hypothetical protein BGZ70_003203 [Mortierella alpina]
MLLKYATILKLTSVTLATLLYGTSCTLAAPVAPFCDPATTPPSATDINCVKVLSPALLRSPAEIADRRPLVVLGGDRIIGTPLRKREDLVVPNLSAVGTSTDANNLGTSTAEPTLPVVDALASSPEESSIPPVNEQGASGDSTDADLSSVPGTVAAQESAPSPEEPAGGLVDPTVPVAPITDAPVFPETPQDAPQVSTPTYPNLPIAVVEEPKRKQTPGEIFAKYAAAGAGILSTIGVGVGGLVGGVIGGAAGLAIGLLLAAVNASFYA